LDTARAIGREIAQREFLYMLNPVYRGPKFTWERFPNMVRSKIETDLPFEFFPQEWEKHEKALLKVALEGADFTINECFELSGVKEWLPVGPTVSGKSDSKL